MIRGIRGAITVNNNDADEIIAATKRMFEEIIKANDIEPTDVAHVLISVTKDLNAAFPAVGMRSIEGWNYVPVMCTNEMPVPGSLPKCIRAMLTVNTNKQQDEIKHIYLEKAVQLRPDLANK